MMSRLTTLVFENSPDDCGSVFTYSVLHTTDRDHLVILRSHKNGDLGERNVWGASKGP